jgi:hypothetical protein
MFFMILHLPVGTYKSQLCSQKRGLECTGVRFPLSSLDSGLSHPVILSLYAEEQECLAPRICILIVIKMGTIMITSTIHYHPIGHEKAAKLHCRIQRNAVRLTTRYAGGTETRRRPLVPSTRMCWGGVVGGLDWWFFWGSFVLMAPTKHTHFTNQPPPKTPPTHPGGGDEISSPCLSASSVAGGESPCVSLNSAMQFGGRTTER